MRIKNLRIENIKDLSYLKVDIECQFSSSNSLWFSVNNEYKDWLTDDIYDALLLAVLWPCMCYGEDITIEGEVTKVLYRNVSDYVISLIQYLKPHYKIPNIKVEGFKDCKQIDPYIVGTGFSGGVDSFSTILDRFEAEGDPEYRINTLFFFHIGQYGDILNPKSKIHAAQHYKISKDFAEEIGIPFIYMDTNLFEFYKPHWEYDAGAICRATSILVFQKVCRKFYVAASFHFYQHATFHKIKTLAQLSDPYIFTLLSTPNCSIELDGYQYYRKDKITKISNYELAHKHLNVCVNKEIDLENVRNCSTCHKCNRTLIVLEALNKLKEFSQVFDIEKYKSQDLRFKSYLSLGYKDSHYNKELVDFARNHGIYIPSKMSAFFRLFPKRIYRRIKSLLKK